MKALEQANTAYSASVRLWFQFVNSSAGHPGISGPSGDGKCWNELESIIQSTIDTLNEVKRHLPTS